jgi:hypothetical protein
MKLETHIASAPTPAITPQTRYASLHRSIEKGMHCDATYVELVKVCVLLKKNDEALRTFEKVKSPRERIHLQSLLLNHRVITSPVLTPEECGLEHADSVQVTHKEDVVSACHFLFQEHMPLTAITLTLAFPLVIGLGGFISQKLHAGWLANVAILPALFTLVIVFGLARRILLDARQDLDDAPSLAGSRDLLLEGAFALGDFAMLAGLLLGPGIVMTQLDLLPGAVLAIALGGFLLPMALVLRTVRCDWRALHPQLLFPTIMRGGLPYLKTSATIGLAFLPALLCGLTTGGTRLYLTISVLGPLIVVPVFIAARLLGRLVDASGAKLVLAEPPSEARASRVAPPASETHLVRLSKSGSVPAPRKPTTQLKRIANTPAPQPVASTVQRRPAASRPAPSRPAPASGPFATATPAQGARGPAPAPSSTRRPAAPAAPSSTRGPAATPPPSSTRGKGTTPPPTRGPGHTPAPAQKRQPSPAAKRPSAPPSTTTAALPPDLASIPGLVTRPGSSRQQDE